MFHRMRNGQKSGTRGKSAAALLVSRLPPKWSIRTLTGRRGTPVLEVRAPDGRKGLLAIRERPSFTPRGIAGELKQSQEPDAMLFVADYLSPRSQALVTEAHASYVDLTGNLRVTLDDPAVFIQGQGAERDPTRQRRGIRSLRGASAGRVVRALCDFAPPYGVRALTKASDIPLGSVSRVVSFLGDEALLSRDARKQVTSVDWPALLARWTQDYDVRGSNRVLSALEPRGLSALLPKLANLKRYAVTGSLAGPSVAPARLAMVYVDDAEAAAEILELVPTEAGANVWLIEPRGEAPFERTCSPPFGAGVSVANLVAAAPSQVVADLMTSPGRAPQEALALVDKMEENESAWRHDTGS